MKTDWLDFKYCILIDAGCKILNSIMDINTELVFEKPIQVYRDYPIYSIANFNGIIMVNTILNGERRLALEENREPKHTLTTNTCEPSSETSIFSKCLKLLGENLLLSTIVNGRVI